jgi:hypothetical protein
MTFIQKYRTSFLTSSSAATAYLPSSTATNPGVINGIVDTILYYKDGTSPPTTTANITITVENTSQVVFNRTSLANESSFEYVPVRQSHITAGTTLAVATAGVPGFPVANSRLIVSLSTAGDAKVGIFEVIVR